MFKNFYFYFKELSYKRDVFISECKFEKLSRTKWIKNVIKDVINIFICYIRGHDLEEQGHAGPEYGYIEMSCKKCGYKYPRHVLY